MLKLLVFTVNNSANSVDGITTRINFKLVSEEPIFKCLIICFVQIHDILY